MSLSSANASTDAMDSATVLSSAMRSVLTAMAGKRAQPGGCFSIVHEPPCSYVEAGGFPLLPWRTQPLRLWDAIERRVAIVAWLQIDPKPLTQKRLCCSCRHLDLRSFACLSRPGGGADCLGHGSAPKTAALMLPCMAAGR